MSLSTIESILVGVAAKVDNIQQEIDKLNTKVCKLENLIQNTAPLNNNGNYVQHHTQVAMVTSISSSEEKIKLLNQQTNFETQEDFLKALQERCTIDDFGVYSILESSINIYDYIVDIIYEFDNVSSCKYMYGFPDVKNTLYFWNHSKKTWAKISKSYLQSLFLEVQQKIIVRYNELMSTNNKLKKECVENGDLIFVDNFEKKYSEFKKCLFSKFV